MAPSAWFKIIVITFGMGGLAAYLNYRFPHILNIKTNQVSFVSTILILSFLILSAVSHRLKLSQVLNYSLGWLLIFSVILSVYSFQPELNGIWIRLKSQLVPFSAEENRNGSISVIRNNDGHFQVEALVNGVTVHFMVDTGATRTVLTVADATRIGIDINNLAYDQASMTANGIVLSAPIKLEKVKIGNIVVNDVKASVNKNLEGMSLLGMSFLERLSQYHVEGERLTMRQ